jgi:hypothetical protein
MSSSLFVQPTEDGSGGCPCCAGDQGMRGFVYDGEEPLAVYLVEPIGISGYPMIRLGLVIGEWAKKTTEDDRVAFCFSCRPVDGAAELTPDVPYLGAFPELTMLGRELTREALAADPALPRYREVALAVIEQDPRLGLIAGRGEPAHVPGRFSAS